MAKAATVPQPLISHTSSKLQGAISIPGDKSISHRALILGALAEGQTRIEGLLEADDILSTAAALRRLGVRIERDGAAWTVSGAGLGGLLPPGDALDFGNSGTGARLMMGVVAGHPITATFTGDSSLCKRPMGRVLDPLRRMGLAVAEEGRTTLPLTLTGTANLVPIVYELPVPSAQVKSAILLAGLLAAGRTTVIEAERTRDHTERMLRYFGAAVTAEAAAGGLVRIAVEGQPALKAQPVLIPGDPSSAAFPAAAAILCEGSDLTIAGVLVNPTRTGFYRTLVEMGADLSFENERTSNGEPVADLRVKTSRLKGVRVPASRAPSMIDEYPCLAVAAAFAEGETVMAGLSELRVKESDRLAAMVEGLTACGVAATADGDTLVVKGGRRVRGGATVAAHMDHRIAMSFLVLGLAADAPVSVDDAAMIATSFPAFVPLMQGLGAAIEAADGPPASTRQGRAARP